MDELVRQLVRERAGNRCEYCRLSQQAGATIRFHIEHIRPRQHGGSDDPENLALACPACNWRKGPNMSAVDPETDRLTPLYNPRSARWSKHFEMVDAEIVGLTDVGRATLKLLRMNDPEYVEVRRELNSRGELDVGN
jgi:HNH endonuclease